MSSLFNIIFRNANTLWGDGKDANLTPDEVDMNFWECISRILELETNGVLPKEIQSIDVTDGQMTITLSDGVTTFGPFELPEAAFLFIDGWTPATELHRFDVFPANEGLYVVLQDHTSAATFDPDAGDMEGPFYQLMFPFPQLYDVGFFIPGKPGFGITEGDPIFSFVAPRAFFLPEPSTEEDLGRAYIATPEDGTDGLTMLVQKNGDIIGGISFASGENTGTIELASDGAVQFEAGDLLQVISPLGVIFPDTTARNLSVTFAAKRGVIQ